MPVYVLLRLSWNKQDPNYLATFAMDSTEVCVGVCVCVSVWVRGCDAFICGRDTFICECTRIYYVWEGGGGRKARRGEG